MFVFKVGVVGDQTMAAEIADLVAKAGIAVAAAGVGGPYDDFADVDLVIVAGEEAMDSKQEVFAELDACTPGHAILASSSATVSITELADATSRPDQVVGIHFFAPVARKRLVEIVEGDDTSPQTAQAAANFARAIRKQPVRCAECPGFVVDRIRLAAATELSDDDRQRAAELTEVYGDRFEVADHAADQSELRAFAEACMVVEEGVAGIRDVDLGMALGAGTAPGPFARADQRGLDDLLAAMQTAEDDWGEAFAPPVLLRRLVAQGRLGAKSGQGFYPYPPTAGAEGPVRLDARGEVAVVWLDNPPANSISGAVVEGLTAAWKQIEAQGSRAMVLASASPALFCAGADVKAFTQMDAAAGAQLLDSVHALLRAWETSSVATIAAVNGLALGGGCELAMACDVRLAGSSATFGQPEVNLGIIPGFGGTQRLPRLVGPAKALEMNLTGEAVSADDAYEHGLVNRVTADHELFDAALAWARKLAGQAPVAVQQIKRAATAAGLDDGIAAEKEGFAAAFASADAHEGVDAFLGRRRPEWRGN